MLFSGAQAESILLFVTGCFYSVGYLQYYIIIIYYSICGKKHHGYWRGTAQQKQKMLEFYNFNRLIDFLHIFLNTVKTSNYMAILQEKHKNCNVTKMLFYGSIRMYMLSFLFLKVFFSSAFSP